MLVNENPQVVIDVLPEPDPNSVREKFSSLKDKVVESVRSAFQQYSPESSVRERRLDTVVVEVARTPPPVSRLLGDCSPDFDASQIFIESSGPFECSIQ